MIAGQALNEPEADGRPRDGDRRWSPPESAGPMRTRITDMRGVGDRPRSDVPHQGLVGRGSIRRDANGCRRHALGYPRSPRTRRDVRGRNPGYTSPFLANRRRSSWRIFCFRLLTAC